MIAIIDYGMGNIGSIENILKSIGRKDIITTSSKKEILAADRIILPGVGAFDEGVKNLKKLDLYRTIQEAALWQRIPVLGICLGMQLLGKYSEEGSEEGLGLLPFSCRKFMGDNGFKVPHMGWDYVRVEEGLSELTRGIPKIQRYYFVHSFYAVCRNTDNILMICNYEREFPAAIYSKNIYGVQFHPEKSHQFGKRLFMNFAGVNRSLL